MMEKIKEVVGIAFIENGKLLISQSVKSAKMGKYTLVGGGVEVGESLIEAAIRECKEEIGNNFSINGNEFELLFDFKETAASDNTLTIHMHMFLAKKAIDVPLESNEEILRYKWFDINKDDKEILSLSISNHLIPYAVANGLMY